MEAHREGMNKRQAAKQFSVPRTTPSRALFANNPMKRQRGPGPILGEDEDRIEAWVRNMAGMGFPITRGMLLQVGQRMATVANKDGNPRAEKITSAEKWVRLFYDRHRSLALRTPEHVSSGQASVSETMIRKHFLEVEARLEAKNQFSILNDPTRMFKTDETGFRLNPTEGRVIAEGCAKGAITRPVG